MACNGWNHYSNCNCGWGGQSYRVGSGGSRGAGFSGVSTAVSQWSIGHIRTESYINKNASCPVCGDRVYFYQSPYNGRVYFDDLAPLWPKHPCTDNRRKMAATVRLSQLNQLYLPTWKGDGWVPFQITDVWEEQRRIVILGKMVLEDSLYGLPIKVAIGTDGLEKADILIDAPAFYKPAAHKRPMREISFLWSDQAGKIEPANRKCWSYD